MSEIITEDALRELASEWIAAGKTLAGPCAVKPGLVLYTRLRDSRRLVLEPFPHPGNSIKEFFFPKHEILYRYRIDGRRIELEDCEPPAADQLILGARPCDAAALPVLDHIFNWDYRDEFYNRRREVTTVVSIACARHDDACFCTSVRLSPASTRGSDALLVAVGPGESEVRTLTEKGCALFAGRPRSSDRIGVTHEGPPRRFDPPHPEFGDPVYSAASLTCLGCGACAYTCPTCHCFDIVDEGGPRGGVRVRNWDSCQFPLFTLHASGHNPRHVQGERQRQRIYHKFHIYPEKFGEALCTGCGNCTRNCPVGLGVLTVLQAMEAGLGKHL